MVDLQLDPARLERLAASFLEEGSEEWQIYADELLARGDPRGELIQLEQRLDETLDDTDKHAALEAQRRAHYEQHRARWLPDWYEDDPDRADERQPDILELRGYFQSVWASIDDDEDPAEHVAWLVRALTCDAALMLTELEVRCPEPYLGEIVDAVARGSGQLRELEIDVYPSDDPFSPILIDAARCQALCARLPHLRKLELSGSRVFAELSLPRLEVLELSGYDAIVGWRTTTHLPALRELDFELLDLWDARDRRMSRTELRALFDPKRLPALRDLKLHNNAAGRGVSSSCHGGEMAEDLFEVMLDAPILAQLERLSLPPPPTPAHARRMLDAPGLAALERVELPRSYFALDPAALARSLVKLELELVFPMRMRGQVDSNELIHVSVPGEDEELEFNRAWFASMLEDAYALLPASTRDYYAALCSELDALAWGPYALEDEAPPPPRPTERRGIFSRLFGRTQPAPAPAPAPPRRQQCERTFGEFATALRAGRDHCESSASSILLSELFDFAERELPARTRVTLRRSHFLGIDPDLP